MSRREPALPNHSKHGIIFGTGGYRRGCPTLFAFCAKGWASSANLAFGVKKGRGENSQDSRNLPNDVSGARARLILSRALLRLGAWSLTAHDQLRRTHIPTVPDAISGEHASRSIAAGHNSLHLPAAVLLDNIRSMYNVGAFFRAADGVNLEKLCLCGITAHPHLGSRSKKAISKTALGAEETVPWEHDWDAVHMAENLRRSGFEIAAIETKPAGAADFGVDLEVDLDFGVDLYDWHPRFPVCVMFGHEVDGLRPELLAIADTHVRIPMLGQKKSLNVATAGGVVLYELLRKYRVLRIGRPLLSRS